jgi:hypothetical protein
VRYQVILRLGAVLAIFLGAAAASAGASPPTLRATSLTPFTIRGTGFAAQEQVRLELRVGRRQPTLRRVRADRDGRFTAKFGLFVALDPCTGTVVVTATGAAGSHATYKKQCRPPSTGDGKALP